MCHSGTIMVYPKIIPPYKNASMAYNYVPLAYNHNLAAYSWVLHHIIKLLLYNIAALWVA